LIGGFCACGGNKFFSSPRARVLIVLTVWRAELHAAAPDGTAAVEAGGVKQSAYRNVDAGICPALHGKQKIGTMIGSVRVNRLFLG
jgi:hypothetical protein